MITLSRWYHGEFLLDREERNGEDDEQDLTSSVSYTYRFYLVLFSSGSTLYSLLQQGRERKSTRNKNVVGYRFRPFIRVEI